MRGAPPLRFLVGVVGGWVCLRAAVLAPAWIEEVEKPLRAPSPGSLAQPSPVHSAEPGRVVACSSCAPKPLLAARKPTYRPKTAPRPRAADILVEKDLVPRAPIEITPLAGVMARWNPAVAPAALPPPVKMSERRLLPARRWSASAWAFVRRGGDAQLAAGGTLGSSQLGARLGYRLNADVAAPLSIVARAYAPANRPSGGELALGLEWQPLREVPLRLLGERRQAVGRGGRSVLALIAHGGASKAIGPGILDVYAQAGIVGARSRDLFADGSVAVALPLEKSGRLKFGAALWGAVQPGVSRVDAGPQVSLSVPVEGRNLRLSADWRIRIAGDASPPSGPALTLATDF